MKTIVCTLLIILAILFVIWIVVSLMGWIWTGKMIRKTHEDLVKEIEDIEKR